MKRSNPMPRRSFRRWLLAMMAATFAMFAGAVPPVSADQGDKQGWSLGSDPRKRVFLRFVPANDGPRVLVLGCLRDVDSFIVLSEQDIGIGHGQAATLTLANGAARFVVEGKFEGDGAGVGRPAFASEMDADGKALQQIRPKLIPVLEGKGPLVLSVGSTSRELPVAGLAKPLNGFKSVCFGQR